MADRGLMLPIEVEVPWAGDTDTNCPVCGTGMNVLVKIQIKSMGIRRAGGTGVSGNTPILSVAPRCEIVGSRMEEHPCNPFKSDD